MDTLLGVFANPATRMERMATYTLDFDKKRISAVAEIIKNPTMANLLQIAVGVLEEVPSMLNRKQQLLDYDTYNRVHNTHLSDAEMDSKYNSTSVTRDNPLSYEYWIDRTAKFRKPTDGVTTDTPQRHSDNTFSQMSNGFVQVGAQLQPHIQNFTNVAYDTVYDKLMDYVPGITGSLSHYTQSMTNIFGSESIAIQAGANLQSSIKSSASSSLISGVRNFLFN